MQSNWLDLKELFLLPAISAALPWPGAQAYFRYAARGKWYVSEARSAFSAAQAFVPVADPEEWMRKYRLGRLLEHADLYFSLTRSDRWLDRRVSVDGNWPEQDPFVIVTFHYGSGFWAIRHLRRAGHVVQLVRRAFDRTQFGSAWLGYRYAALRTWATDRAFGKPSVPDDAHSLRRMRQTLKNGGSVIGLMDVPVREGQNALRVSFLGRTASFPRGLFYLARTANVPIVVYTMRNDKTDLTRKLRISSPISSVDEQLAAEAVARVLDAAIVEDSTEWHHWIGAESFFPRFS